MNTRLRLLLTVLAATVVLAACGAPPPPETQYELAVTVAGTGSGSVTSDPTGIDTGVAAFAAPFDAATNVTLTATAAAGSTFTGWSGDCTGAAATCVVAMDSAKDVTATFALDVVGEPVTLTVNVVTGGSATGSVTSSPAGIDVDQVAGTAAADFDLGATVTLTAAEGAGAFAGWTGGDCAGLLTLTCDVTIGVGEAAVTANFNDVVTAPLVVTVSDSEEFVDASIVDSDRWRAGFSRADSSDLELVFDAEHARQVVGLRFSGVAVPAGARVVNTVLTFTARDVPSTGTADDVTVTIAAEAALAPAPFATDPGYTDGSFDISSRTTTSATADWAISGAWVVEATYATTNAAAVLQEVVGLTGWTSGGDVVFVLSGDGIDTDYRRAYSLEQDPLKAATLLVEYAELPLP